MEGLSTSLTFAYLKNRLRISRRLRRVRIPAKLCRTPSISRHGRPGETARSAEGTDAEPGTEAISLSGRIQWAPNRFGCTRSKTGRVLCLYISWAEPCEADILLCRSPYNAFPWRKPDAIHRRYLETSPRHYPGRSGRGAPVVLRRQGSGRLTLTADGRMMSVVCDGGTSSRPTSAGNIAATL